MPDNTKTNAYSAAVTIGVIQRLLDRIVAYLAETHVTPEGCLSPADQWAVRILESRKRLYDRIYQSQFGEDRARAVALCELSLARPDNGDLMDWAGRRHGVGRLDCRACLVDYVNGDGPVPIRRTLTAVCPHCKGGVLHVASYEIPVGNVVITVRGGETSPVARQGGLEGILGPVKLYKCDNCGVSAYTKTKA
jgi:hypothetical protein